MRRTVPALRDYQHAGIGHLRAAEEGAGLFLDMGLGKTAITLSALREEHLPALVVAPKRVAENVWSEERDLWRPDLSMKLALGAPARREEALRSNADLVVISRDNLRQAEAYAPRFRTLVLDELSGFKSPSSVRFKTARRMRKTLPRVWGLTGTPTPNGLLDLWSQVYLLDGGERLGTSVTRYRETYFTARHRLPNGIVTAWDLRPGADKAIHSLIDDICLSMSSEGRVELPATTINRIEVPLDPAVRRIYKTFRRELAADIRDVLGYGELHTAAGAAVLTAKLSQITAGFLYVDDADLRGGASDYLHNNKTRAVREVVEGSGRPVLVFYRFKAELDALRAELGELAYTMDEPDVQKRWNRGEFPVLLAHPASAGHGLNLQYGGETIVWTSLPWSLEEWQQGNKRLARSGQEHPVMIHVLVSPRTIDEVIERRLTGKASVQQDLIDHLESPI